MAHVECALVSFVLSIVMPGAAVSWRRPLGNAVMHDIARRTELPCFCATTLLQMTATK